MSQIVGLIELEPDGITVAELAAPSDDATLEALFARLVHSGDEDADDEPANGVVTLPADLDLLGEDLAEATRHLRQNRWLARGGYQ